MRFTLDGEGAPFGRNVLIVDDDRDIGDLVRAILTDEGFSVSLLHHQQQDTLRIAVNQLEPDCILLDGASPGEYGSSWEDAAWIANRDRAIPVIMFTAHQAALDEADTMESERSRDARFSGILPKPFDLDRLVSVVSRSVGLTAPFDGSDGAEQQRTAMLVARLTSMGATDIHASTRREWASFITPAGAFLQLYWWQRDGVYYLVRFAPSGGRLETVGRFFDLGTAISVAMSVPGDPSADGMAIAQPVHAGAAQQALTRDGTASVTRDGTAAEYLEPAAE